MFALGINVCDLRISERLNWTDASLTVGPIGRRSLKAYISPNVRFFRKRTLRCLESVVPQWLLSANTVEKLRYSETTKFLGIISRARRAD